MTRSLPTFALSVLSLVGATAPAPGQFTLDTSGIYLQNFNGIGGGLPTGFTVRTGATATGIGTDVTSTNYEQSAAALTNNWGATTGGFRNLASFNSGLASNANGTQQAAAADRALGVRQGTLSSGFADPGAAFTFQVNAASATTIDRVRLEAQILSSQPRSTTWTVRYGLGADPASFTNLGTFTDPGTFSSTPLDFSTVITPDASNLLTFQVVALSASTGSGNRDTFAIDNFVLNYTPVPEPAAVLAAAGGLGLVRLRRRRG